MADCTHISSHRKAANKAASYRAAVQVSEFEGRQGIRPEGAWMLDLRAMPVQIAIPRAFRAYGFLKAFAIFRHFILTWSVRKG